MRYSCCSERIRFPRHSHILVAAIRAVRSDDGDLNSSVNPPHLSGRANIRPPPKSLTHDKAKEEGGQRREEIDQYRLAHAQLYYYQALNLVRNCVPAVSDRRSSH